MLTFDINSTYNTQYPPQSKHHGPDMTWQSDAQYMGPDPAPGAPTPPYIDMSLENLPAKYHLHLIVKHNH